MHFMHFGISLLFLALFMGMAAAYFLAGYCLLRSLPYLVQRVKKRGEPFFKVSFKKVLISCFTVAVIAFLPVYITSRMEGSITRLYQNPCVHTPGVVALAYKEARHGTPTYYSPQDYRS